MHVFLLAPDLRTLGGFELQLTELAAGLTQAGVKVDVYIREPVRSDHPYWQRMSAAGVGLHAPSPIIAKLLTPPLSWRIALLEFLSTAISLISWPLVVVDAVWQRRSFGRSWQGARGKIRGRLGGIVDFDGLTGWMWRQLDGGLRQARPDLIDVQHSMLPSGIVYGKARGLPVIYTEYGAPSENLRSVWSGLHGVINRADLIICRSEASMTGLRALCAANRPYAVVPNAVSLPADVVTELPSRNDPVTITAIGRLSPEKGVAYLLEAFHLLAADSLSAQLIFAGDGPLRSELESKVAKWGLNDKVSFTGAFDSLSPILQATHIVAHPTLNDGRSVAVLEAMAWGRPVVASCVGGIPELIEDNVTGLLVAPGDPQALAEAIRRLALDRETRTRLGRAARAKFLAGNYSPQGMVTATLQLYGRVLPEQGRA